MSSLHGAKTEAQMTHGKTIRRRFLAPYLMAVLAVVTIATAYSSFICNPVVAQSEPESTSKQSETAQSKSARSSTQSAPAQSASTQPAPAQSALTHSSLTHSAPQPAPTQSAAYDLGETETAQDAEDRERVEKFKRFIPEKLRRWLPEARKRVHHHTPLLSYKHWSSEPKRFVPTLLFCLFTGLIGVAFFSSQISVAQNCCKTQFWHCLAKASLSGITVLISVIVLDRLGITGSLATLLVAVLELVVVAGLSVGVSLIGERVVEKTGLVKIEYLKSHPRFATFTKVLIGSLIIALIVQIPGLGKLPRIGIRIATLIAVLGAGGLLKTRFGTQPVSSD